VRSAVRIALASSWIASAAFGADFVVNRYDDPAPDGCLPLDCSLREAVIAVANGGSNRIVLSAGTYQLSIPDAVGGGSLDGGLRVGGTLEIVGVGSDLTRIDGAGISDTILTGEGAALALTLRGLRFERSDENGVLLLDGAAVIEDCSFVDHGTVISGAGLAANLAVDSLVVRRSTFARNSGAGLSVSAATTTLENITSTANGQFELAITGNGSTSVVSCNHCTLVHESGTGDEVRVSFTSATFSNSIVAGSCVFGTNGAIDSAGGNVESTGASCQFDQASDLPGATSGELQLGALAANGGLTPTIAPGPASVVLGAALDALCADEDQRGAVRVADCESGAFEATAAPVPQALFLDGLEQGNAGAWSDLEP
jgi:hypothetical protein